MIGESALMVDIDPRQMRRFYDLVLLSPKKRRLFLLHDNGRVVKAVDTETGLKPDLWGRIEDPEARAKELFDAESGVEEVWILERSAVRHYLGAVQATYTPNETGDEYFDRAFRSLGHYPGGIVKYPPDFPGLRYTGIEWVEARDFVRRYLPPDSVLILAAFDGEEIWTSWIVTIRDSRIVRITSSDAIMDLDGRLRDWRSRYRELVEKCNVWIGQVSLGLFMDREALEGLVASSRKREFLREALIGGRVIADPLPDAVAAAIA